MSLTIISEKESCGKSHDGVPDKSEVLFVNIDYNIYMNFGYKAYGKPYR